MKPGKELNALIATKIMGWKDLGMAINDVHDELHWLDPDQLEKWSIPNYSVSIAAAWDVVEKLRSAGLIVSVGSYPDGKTWLKPPFDGAPGPEWTLQTIPEHYICDISKQHPDWGMEWVCWGDGVGLSPAHAICLAALDSIGRDA